MESRRQRKGSRFRTRVGAASLAVLLHIGFVVAVLATASGTLPRGASDPFGEGETIAVSLSGREGAAGGRPGSGDRERPTDIDQTDLMAKRLRAERSDLFASEAEPSRPRGGLASLFRSIGSLSASGRQGNGAQRDGQSDDGGREAITSRASRAGAPSQDDGSRGLWGQVEPCWRRLKQRSTVLVTLEVVLNDEGGLAAPPRIIRPEGGRPNEQRLVAEAQALAAIQACLPYQARSSLRAGDRYRLDFGSAR